MSIRVEASSTWTAGPQEAQALQKLIKEAQRIHTEISIHLSKIRHAGHPSAPNKKG